MKKNMLKYCKGIPQLLAFCCNGIDACNNALSKIEFGVVIQYMKECGITSWMEEINLGGDLYSGRINKKSAMKVTTI